MFYIILGFILFMYLSIGMIIGLEISFIYDKWYKKVGIIMFKIIFWLPNIPADMIAGNMIDSYERRNK